jgi:uncharacterized protein YaiE (UPF0345 family)
MPLNLASPGIVVREVDLTVGRVNAATNKVGAIVAPFAKGPTDVPVLVETENDLLSIFGEPYAVDKHYEHWMVASSYLAYGGTLQVVRSDDDDLKNAFVGSASSIKIKSLDHYNQLGYDENTITGVTFAAKNPGSWANGIKVALIDAFADQIVTLPTAAVYQVGMGVTQTLSGVLAGVGATSLLSGYLKGIVTGVGAASGLSTNQIAVKVLSTVTGGTEADVDYQPRGTYAFSSGNIAAIDNLGLSVSGSALTATSVSDWFDAQTISISTVSSIPWNNIAQRPSTTSFAEARGSRFDEVHVVVLDASGAISGNAGTILEKHLSLSKASDAEFSVGSPSYWRKYLASNSDYLFGGSAPSGITTAGFTTSFVLAQDTGWDQEAYGTKFAVKGNENYTLGGGLDYHGAAGLTTTGALTAPLTKLSSGYGQFESADTYKVDFLLMGSANHTKETAQALANKLIAVAELRKDAIAFISPYRGAFLSDTAAGSVTVNSDDTITDNIISFYSPITSSSYAVFDGGYKYAFDRFSNTFRYIPLNGDIAGLCARNDIRFFPWYSPAGTTRGSILNAVKLAYNPTKSQRDRLYSNRINPVIFSSGSGIILFGDRTGLAKASAFDRINVRRLFIYLENAIAAAAKDQLFEFNDEITRTNFVNIVEPFLRDVKAKRGIYDYVVVCDETNNTAAIIDNNEFVADIYVKPARSINFIGLTFVATRTGVAFDEVIGTF